jgi:hypothetical protein
MLVVMAPLSPQNQNSSVKTTELFCLRQPKTNAVSLVEVL